MHRLTCGIGAVAMTFGLFGCAEIDRRGGLVDQIEDRVFFRADTKSHRLLRAYVLIGTLVAVARRHGADDIDKVALAGRLRATLEVFADAYVCVFPNARAVSTAVQGQPSTTPATTGRPPNVIASSTRCQFFDEKMSRLDYAIYRLAILTLLDKESRQFLADVRDRLVGSLPIATDAVKTLLHASAAVRKTTTFIDELLQLNFHGAETFLYLAPIYRDVLELDMWVIIDHLEGVCNPNKLGRKPSANAQATYSTDPELACSTYDHAIRIFKNGNGHLRVWREFIKKLDGEVLNVNAGVAHFDVVNRWMWLSCLGVLDRKECDDIGTKVMEKMEVSVNPMVGGSRMVGGRFWVSNPSQTTVVSAVPKQSPPAQATRVRAQGDAVKKRQEISTTGLRTAQPGHITAD